MNGETLIIVGIGVALCIFIGVILIVVGHHDYNESNRETEINLGISLIIAPIAVTLMYFAYGDSDSSEQDKAIEAYENGNKVYINGNPVEDGFDINGINLDKYDIRIENDTIYLMSK